MFRRTFWLVLLLIATQASSGCWYWCHRPFFFRRCDTCCYGGGATCGCDIAPAQVEYGTPIGPTGPTMPSATPLTRR